MSAKGGVLRVILAVLLIVVLAAGLFALFLAKDEGSQSLQVRLHADNYQSLEQGQPLSFTISVQPGAEQQITMRYEISPDSREEIIWQKEAAEQIPESGSFFEEAFNTAELGPGTYKLQISADDGAVQRTTSVVFTILDKGSKREDAPESNENEPFNGSAGKDRENQSLPENKEQSISPENAIAGIVLLAQQNPEEAIASCAAQQQKDDCFHELAKQLNESRLCSRINSPAIKDGCYFNAALIGDFSLCGMIQDSFQKHACTTLGNS
jgi:hypothetical protein